ncbi:MAG: MFS transporter, partial [Lentisphaeraceae bacterium]|nr:MFS transporter [Lentisphaeraceae bacterium]
LGIFSLFLPKTPAPKKGTPISFADLFFLDVWKEFKRPSFFIFVLCSFLVCIPLQAYYAYLQTQMTTQGFTNISIWKNVGTWLEAGMMFAMPFFFIKLGVKKMIALGIFAWVVRYALFAMSGDSGVITADSGVNINGFQIPFDHMGFLVIIAGVALRGFCYDFFFGTGQIYVDQTTDKKIRAQAQSMMIFFTQGLGMYIGAKFINNNLFQKAFGVDNIGAAYGKATDPAHLTDWSNFWWPLCAIAAAVLVLFIVTFKHKDKEGAEFSH